MKGKKPHQCCSDDLFEDPDSRSTSRSLPYKSLRTQVPKRKTFIMITVLMQKRKTIIVIITPGIQHWENQICRVLCDIRQSIG